VARPESATKQVRIQSNATNINGMKPLASIVGSQKQTNRGA